MAIVGEALADGQLPNAEGVLYTVPGGTIAYVKSIVYTNTHAVNTNTCFILVRLDGANSRRLIKVPLATDEQLYYDEALTLEAADEIRGYATNAAEVDYVISGAEEA